MPDYPVFIEPEEALSYVIAEAKKRLMPVESVPIEQSLGRCVQAPVVAKINHPPFNRAAMDGFAVAFDGNEAEQGSEFTIIGESHAGIPFGKSVGNGEAVRISTGAVVPEGAVAILPVEDATEAQGRVVANRTIKRLANIALKGEDKLAGEVILSCGEVVSAAAVSALASEGISQIWVRRKPRIAVVSTGDEVVPYTEEAQQGKIRDMNTPAIEAWSNALQFDVVCKLHANDLPDSIISVLRKAFDCADVVLLSGGVSAGERDLVVATLLQLGAKIHFHKVRQKPGKPLLFATIGSKVFFGLPGNPLTAVLMLELYVLPALRAMQELPYRRVWLTAKLVADYVVRGKRDVFEVASVIATENGFELLPLKGTGSADVFKRAGGNAVAFFPARVKEFVKGSQVKFSFLLHSVGWCNDAHG